MENPYPHIQSDVLELMGQLSGDWEYSGPITPDTSLFGDLGFESLDLVVLGAAIQERYGQLPFAEFLAQIGQRPERDLSVGELVAFIGQHQGSAANGGTR